MGTSGSQQQLSSEREFVYPRTAVGGGSAEVELWFVCGQAGLGLQGLLRGRCEPGAGLLEP